MTSTDEPDHAGVVAPAPVFFAVAMALGYGLEWLLPTSLSFAGATAVGVALIAASVGLALAAVVPLARAGTAFDARKPTTRIVTGGAFRICRNPVYLSLALLQAGLAFCSHSLWVLLATSGAVGATHFGVVLREERYLERKFGDHYRRYAAAVRRWI